MFDSALTSPSIHLDEYNLDQVRRMHFNRIRETDGIVHFPELFKAYKHYAAWVIEECEGSVAGVLNE